MKKTTKRNLAVILCALLLASSLVSCKQTASENTGANANTNTSVNSGTSTNTSSGTSSSSDKPSADQQTQGTTPSNNQSSSSNSTSGSSDVNNDIYKDKYEEQIKYYMDLTESLQAELLELKEDNYIDECEYQLQISALEQTIQNLNDTISALKQGNAKLPTSSIDPSTPDKVVAKNDFKYSTEGGQVTITGYNGTGIDVEIPSNIDGFPVTKIGEEAFKNALIRSVVIPSSVRTIDWFAFSGCTCLESVTIPSSVLTISYGAFDYCPKTMKVNCDKGSYAEAYALSWGMTVVAK